MKTSLRQSRTTPLRIAASYLLFGVIWILLSDYVVSSAGESGEELQRLQSIKGILFVVASASLIYWLVHRSVKRIARSSAMLIAVAQGTTDAVFVKNNEGRYVMVNSAGARFMNLQAEDVLGRSDADMFPPHSARIIQESDRQVLESQQTHTFIEHLEMRGTLRIFQATKAPYRDHRGKIIGLVGISRDITEQAKAQESLRESEQRFRALFERSSDGILITETDGRIVDANDAACTMLRRSREELTALYFADLVAADQRHRIPGAIANLIAHGTCATEWILQRNDGSRFTADERASLLPDGRFLLCIRDITQRIEAEQTLRETEEQLRQARKMLAIGQLAGGIAHDFNNMLTVINGYCDLLCGQTPDDDPRTPLLAGIADAGERASSLTHQLLAFSRRQVLEPRTVDLNEAVRGIEGMLRRLIGDDVELITDLANDLRSVRVDPGQMGQVIMNLVVNARDAMPQGGQIKLMTRNVELNQSLAARHPSVASGPCVMLAISDNGIGMNPETRSQLFEPFFTTKKVGQGTGLGLAVVHGIVSQSGGFIDVTSEPGQGSTFSIYLPATGGDPSPQPPSADDAVTQGNESVLIVEDDASVRDFTRIALETQGYRVISADSPAHAIELVDAGTDTIDLVVTDIVMPQISGIELAQTLRDRHPKLRILFVSGHTGESAFREAKGIGTAVFLQKPFTSMALARKVRQLLDEPAS